MRRPNLGKAACAAWLLAASCLGAAVSTANAADAPKGVAAKPIVRDAWARATPPGSGVAAVYLTLVGGSQADRLLGASTVRAEMTQVHSVEQQAGMSRMRPVDGLDLAAGKMVTFAPETMHLMLMNLAQPLVAGEHFTVQLRFAQAGVVEATVEVVSAAANGPTRR
jgi:copper(I)-binding protein